eukprot:COSAG03_NODE_4604_length_1492_cov_29.669777_3_plen_105_part_01
MSSPPSTLKDLYRSSTATPTRDTQSEEPQREPERRRIAPPDPDQSTVSESASRTEDLEHLFGGSDLSTAVKALYDFDAPHEFFGSLNRFVKRKDKEIEEVCSNYY